MKPLKFTPAISETRSESLRVRETRRSPNLFLIFYSYKESRIIRSKIKHFTISAMAFDVGISLTLEVKGCAGGANAGVCLIFIVLGQRT